jgi:proline iminopeptidase
MRSCTPAVLLAGVVLLQASCHGPGPASTPGGTPTPVQHEGYLDAGGGVRLFYRMMGAGRDTLVVLHGGPGFNLEYLAEDLEPLAARHTLLFYDQRGAGRSSLVSDSLALDGQRFAEDLDALRRHFGFERLTLLGHSWGAGVAALYAARYPDRIARLLIVSGLPLRATQRDEAFEQLARSRDTLTRRRMREWMEARLADPGDPTACRAYYALWFRPFFADSTAALRGKGDFCAGTPEARRNKIRSVDRFTMASLGQWDWRDSLRRVTAPALIIHGTRDVLPVAGAREWAGALPHARLLLLEGIGHFPYLEAPARFFTAVHSFLQGRWPQGTQTVATH